MIIARGKLTGGTDYTRHMALRHKKQLLGIDLSLIGHFDAASLAASWIPDATTAVHSWKDSQAQSGIGQAIDNKQDIEMDWIDKATKAREKLKSEHPELFQKIVEILFRHDPVYINYETNDDEYEPEAGTIILRLEKCTNSGDVRKVVYEEFIRWFYDDIGDESEYENLSKEIWEVWSAYQPKSD